MNLALFAVHGFIKQGESSDGSQLFGTCPFCGEHKFYVNTTNGLWDCKRCGRSGNPTTFLLQKGQVNAERLTGRVLNKLVEDRQGIKAHTLQEWGVGWDGKHYTIPMRGNNTQSVRNMKCFIPGGRSLATKGCHLTGMICDWSGEKEVPVYICEGEWDAMIMWQVLRRIKEPGDVLAVPGAGNMPEDTMKLLVGRRLVLLYDADEAGKKGMESAVKKLETIAAAPIHTIHWNAQDIEAGRDVRDLYLLHKASRTFFRELVRKVKPYKDEKESAQKGRKCKELNRAGMLRVFTKWLRLASYEPLDVMFATVLANWFVEGDPVWLFLVAPPGGVKTELLMTLSDAAGIMTTTTLTPHALISGAQFGREDPSLIPQLDGKVLVIKDFTTILTGNIMARDEIFGVLRDAYDGKIEKYFGNGVVRRYHSKFGILAGVTPIIESTSSANTVLGERFLKCRITATGKHIHAGKNAIAQAMQNLQHNDRMREELREAASRVLARQKPDKLPKVPQGYMHRIALLAQWVSVLRGVVSREKYTGQLQYKPMTEVGTRLAKQLLKLSLGLGLFREEDALTDRTFDTITRVAYATIPDRVEELVKQLFLHTAKGEGAVSLKDLCAWCHLPEGTARFLLQDLALLQVCMAGEDRGTWVLKKGMLKVMQQLGLYKEELSWKSGL